MRRILLVAGSLVAVAFPAAAQSPSAEAGLRYLSWPGKAARQAQPQTSARPDAARAAPAQLRRESRYGPAVQHQPVAYAAPTPVQRPAPPPVQPAYAPPVQPQPQPQPQAAYAPPPPPPVQAQPVQRPVQQAALPQVRTPQPPQPQPQPQQPPAFQGVDGRAAPPPRPHPALMRLAEPAAQQPAQQPVQAQPQTQAAAQPQVTQAQRFAAAPPRPAADDGESARYYSVHRQYGRTPDRPELPQDFFGETASGDLAEPPPVPEIVRDRSAVAAEGL